MADRNELDDIIAISINDAAAVKAARKEKPVRKTKSYKPLEFVISENDRPIKAAIIQHLNAQGKTYDDFKEYCIELYGDKDTGSRFMYNTVYSLKKRPGLMDDTISILLDYLNLDMLLLPKGTDNIKYLAANLVMALKQDPDRLDETLEYIESQLSDYDSDDNSNEADE